jgi:YD repeat-containing protein
MKNSVLILPFIMIVFFSCKKDTTTPDPNPNPNSKSKIKTYTEDITTIGNHFAVTFNLNYDANDRLTSIVSTSNPGDKFLIQYTSTNTFTLDIFNSNELEIHELFFLNSSSLVDSSFQYNSSNDTTTEKYLYNASKQLIIKKEFDYSKSTGSQLWNTHNYTYDGSGNMTSDIDDFSQSTYDYTNLVADIPLFFFDGTYSGKSINLVKTSTYSSGGATEVTNHTYTFDSQNRLITERAVNATTGDIVVKTYTYY